MTRHGWPLHGAKLLIEFEWMCPCSNTDLDKFMTIKKEHGIRQILCVICERKWTIKLALTEIK